MIWNDSNWTESNEKNIKTFQPVVPVLLLPLVQQDVEVPRTLKEAKVARWWWRRENSLELPATAELILTLCQNANIVWSQHVQNCLEEVLTETERRLQHKL